MVIRTSLNLLGLFLFLFIFWKKLKEDYLSTQIFNTSFYVLVAILIAHLLSKNFFQDSWFWLTFSGIGAGLTLGIVRYRLRIFETLEGATISFLPWLGLIFLLDSIVNSSLTSLIGSLVILGLIFLYLFLDKHYKEFSWYKSGRVGFSGLTVLGIFFLIRAFVAASFDDVVSLGMGYDALLSGVAAFTSFIAVFNLARR